MLHLFIHRDAVADLVALRAVDGRSAARILALLETLKDDPDLLDRLTQHEYGRGRVAEIHVSRWIEQWNKGRNLWRLKIWDLEGKGVRQRIVYAFEPTTGKHHVLGVVPREFNNDSDHPLSRRIFAAYDDL